MSNRGSSNSSTSSSSSSSTSTPSPANPPRLRAACDTCHQLKVRCSGGLPCERCILSLQENACFYSVANRLGRPKGAKNKRPSARSMNAASSSTSGTTESKASRREQQRQAQASSSPPEVRTPPVQFEGPGEDPSFILSPKMADMVDMIMTDDSESRQLAWGPESYSLSAFLEDGWDYTSSIPSLDKNVFTGSHKDDYPEMMVSHQKQHPFLPTTGPSLLASLNSTPPTPHDTDMTGLHHFTTRMNCGIGCTCMQRHTELLCALKRSRLLLDLESGMHISRVLSNIHEVLTASRALTECGDCVANNDQEVILLSVMCIRAVVSQLQRVSWGHAEDANNSTTTSTNTTSGETISSSSREIDIKDNTASTQGLEMALSGDLASATAPLIGMSKEVPVLIGDFEVVGSDKSIMLQVLKSLTLRNIETVLLGLADTVNERRRAHLPSSCSSSSSASSTPGFQQLANVGLSAGGGGTVLMDFGHDTSSGSHVETMIQDLLQFIKTLQSP